MVSWGQNGAGEGVGLVLFASAYIIACTFAVDCNTVDEYRRRVCHRGWGGMDRRIGKVDVDEMVEDSWRVSKPTRRKSLWDGDDDDGFNFVKKGSGIGDDAIRIPRDQKGWDQSRDIVGWNGHSTNPHISTDTPGPGVGSCAILMQRTVSCSRCYVICR